MEQEYETGLSSLQNKDHCGLRKDLVTTGQAEISSALLGILFFKPVYNKTRTIMVFFFMYYRDSAGAWAYLATTPGNLDRTKMCMFGGGAWQSLICGHAPAIRSLVIALQSMSSIFFTNKPTLLLVIRLYIIKQDLNNLEEFFIDSLLAQLEADKLYDLDDFWHPFFSNLSFPQNGQ